jgi:hypothetical protein
MKFTNTQKLAPATRARRDIARIILYLSNNLGIEGVCDLLSTLAIFFVSLSTFIGVLFEVSIYLL